MTEDLLIQNLGIKLSDQLALLGVPSDLTDINVGPQVIRYEFSTEGRVSKIKKFQPELMYTVGAESLRILAPIPGKKAIGIEINHPERKYVSFNSLGDLPSDPRVIPLGITPDGDVRYMNLLDGDGPHVLVGGTTGGGKSSWLHTVVCSLLSRFTPEQVELLLVDTKRVELTRYENVKHVALIATDPWEAIGAFRGLVDHMEHRYEIASELGARNLDELNAKLAGEHYYPPCIVIVDELADLMMTAKADMQEFIVRIAQKARAMGLHLILATQSPRREIVNGLLKSNIPSRLAFATTSELDSRIILDQMGAGALLGKGDALFSAQGRPVYRVQTPLVTDDEIGQIANRWV